MPVFCILCTELRRPGWPNFLRQHSFEIYREACKFQGTFTSNVQVTTVQILHYVRQRNVSVRSTLATQGARKALFTYNSIQMLVYTSLQCS